MSAFDRVKGRKALRLLLIALTAAIALTASASSALAAFGLNGFDVRYLNRDGSPATQAGSHPFALRTDFAVNSKGSGFEALPEEELRDLIIDQVAGLVGDTTAVPRCTTSEFLSLLPNESGPECPDSSAVGVVANNIAFLGLNFPAAVYNLDPPPGVAVQLGFIASQVVPVTIDFSVATRQPHNVVATLHNVSQAVKFFTSSLELWGTPADPDHDPYRGSCVNFESVALEPEGDPPNVPSKGNCPTNIPNKPFLTLPTSCTGPVATTYSARSWPGSFDQGGVLTHDDSVPPNPQGFTGCEKLGFSPSVESRPSTVQAETGSGFDFSIDFADEGLVNPAGIAESGLKGAVVTLPEGVTVNPSVGEGLGVCTPSELDRETLVAAPGSGCPNASKIGAVRVDTPLVEEPIEGSIFLAQQDDPATATAGAENPFDSLIAFYIVLKHPKLGILVKLPARVEPDPNTGQLVVSVEDSPQFPFSRFNLHLREGQRAPLITPPSCGSFETTAMLKPWARPSQPIEVRPAFEITSGIGGGPCPPGGIPPFKPDFEAGAVSNNAGSFSPFNMRLLRNDGEQDLTKFSSILPPGELGSLAGVGKCSDAAIAIAKSKTGREESASPTCPVSSQIGHTLAGAGVGGALTYVSGNLYLGGPYKGAPLSVISITPAIAGPFDAGTVAVRLGLDLNPKTAEVEVDGAASDPIPHILKGIVLKLRDLRVYVDRPNFTLNPTSCDESSTKATLFGSYLDVFSPADDIAVNLSSRYQAANCLNLGFKPRLNLSLKGGTTRGGHPALKAVYKPRKGDANLEGLVVRLPRSAFLEQGHIRTICTRVQFAADNCPKAAQYGHIKAWTPLLDQPLTGPVWLRSSSHDLPDMVFDLHGLVDVEVATRIDSIKGGIRARVEQAPDAPLSKVVLQMQGQKKGLIVNSRNLCDQPNRATAAFAGHNGKRYVARPALKPNCEGKRKG